MPHRKVVTGEHVACEVERSLSGRRVIQWQHPPGGRMWHKFPGRKDGAGAASPPTTQGDFSTFTLAAVETFQNIFTPLVQMVNIPVIAGGMRKRQNECTF